MELDGVAKGVYWDVVDHCYLCDMCFMTKCPYVPPHEWNVDFPHLMLRAKAVKYRKGQTRRRDRILTSTDAVGRLAGIPVVAQTVNAANRNGAARKLLDKVLGVHPGAVLPSYHSRSLRKRLQGRRSEAADAEAVGRDHRQGRVVRHLLRQLQRARHRRGPGGRVRAQRHSGHHGGAGTLLRHAQAGAGRSGCRARSSKM